MRHAVCQQFSYRNHIGTPGACQVEIFDHGDRIVFVIHEIGQGVSVTNAAENIQTELVKNPKILELIPHLTRDKSMFIEHYPKQPSLNDTWDRVICDWDGEKKEFMNPTWQPVPMFELKEYTGNHYPK